VKKPARLRRSTASPPSLRRSRRLPLPRRPLEWGLAIVAVALVAIAVTSLGTGSSSSLAATKRTATVGKGVVQSTVSGNGTLEPAQKVELGFGASGEVTAIRVKAGQKVTKGEVLAEVDSSSARAALASAEAQLIEAEEAVEAAEEAEGEESEEVAYEGGARTVFVGLMSEDGTGAAKADEAEKKAAAEKEAAEKAAPEEEGEEQKEPVGKEEKTTPTQGKEEETKEEKPEVSGGASSESSAPTEGGSETGGGNETGASGGVSLPTAEANLLSAELSVKSARQEVRETTLRAPISGTIASVSGSVGETVSGGSGSGNSEASSPSATGEETGGGGTEAFMVLAQLQRLKMEVSFSEADIGKVREGQTATVAIASMEGTELAGKVTKVSLLPSEGSSSVVEYPATILLTQSAKGLRAGMSASAEVVVEQVKNALTVPTEAISQAAGGKTVTVEEEGKEVTKTVTTGLAGDETTEVVSGVKTGQTLVLPEATVAAASEGSGGGSLEELRGSGGGTFPFAGGATGGPPGGAAQFFGGGG
jgi:multidrug efflux pump subunit AcrA (membrane-fusion protein)